MLPQQKHHQAWRHRRASESKHNISDNTEPERQKQHRNRFMSDNKMSPCLLRAPKKIEEKRLNLDDLPPDYVVLFWMMTSTSWSAGRQKMTLQGGSTDRSCSPFRGRTAQSRFGVSNLIWLPWIHGSRMLRASASLPRLIQFSRKRMSVSLTLQVYRGYLNGSREVCRSEATYPRSSLAVKVPTNFGAYLQQRPDDSTFRPSIEHVPPRRLC